MTIHITTAEGIIIEKKEVAILMMKDRKIMGSNMGEAKTDHLNLNNRSGPLKKIMGIKDQGNKITREEKVLRMTIINKSMKTLIDMNNMKRIKGNKTPLFIKEKRKFG
jgi:hypothetical protein